MSRKQKFDEIDEQLFPDKKYKGILYEPRQKHVGEEDIKVSARREKKEARSKHRADRYAKSKPGTDPKKDKKRLILPEGSPKRRTGRPDAAAATKSSGVMTRKAVMGEKIFRNVLVACVVGALVSVIAIPTAFAQPTTNVTLNIGGRVMEAPTTAQTVEEFLTDNKVEIGQDDILEVSLDTRITEGMEIIIRRAIPITVTSEDNTVTVSMVTGTVQDALDKAGVVPDEHDEVYPSPETFIRPGMKIEHIKVHTDTRVEYRSIAYEKTEVEDTALDKGKTYIKQEGEEGELKLVFDQVWKNGVMTLEELTSEETTKEPVTEITAVGTYVAPPPPPKVKISDIKSSSGSGSGGSSSGGSSGSGGSSSSGGSSGSGGGSTPQPDAGEAPSGGSSMTMRVTAYCSACNTGNKTATGTYPTAWSTIAAKTSVFPYGTKLYVEGFGYGIVEDTGGFPATTIDVYIGERASCNCGSEWNTGNRTVTVVG